jgi:hypothetical protein
MSVAAEEIVALQESVERRFYPRVTPSDPVYIGPDSKNQGMLLNVSENGLLVSTPVPLKVNFVSRISVPVNGLTNAINGYARVIWASEATNCAGIQLLELSEQDRKQLREWIAAEFAKSSRRQAERILADAETFAMPPGPDLAVESPKNTNAIAPMSALALRAHVVRRRPASLVEVATWGFLIGSLSVAAVMFGRDIAPRPRGGSVAGDAGGSVAVEQNQLMLQTSNSSASVDSDAVSSAVLDSSGSTVSQNVASHDDALPVGPALKTSKDRTAISQGPHSNPVESADGTLRTATSFDATSAEVTSADTAPHNPRAGTVRRQDGATQADARSKQASKASSVTKLSASVPAARDAGSNRVNPLANLSALKSTAASRPQAYASAANTAAKSAEERSDGVPEPYPVPAKIISTDVNPATRSNIALGHSPATPVNGTRNSGAPVIQMNLPSQQAIFEVRSAVGFRTTTLSLPNSRIVESPGVTMRIERSLLLPATRKWWPFDRKRTVAVGELVSRVDPQPPYAALGPGAFVRVQATVGKNGRVERLELVSGPAVVVPDVMRAIREWRYQPTLVDGKPVETECDIAVQFHSAVRGAR